MSVAIMSVATISALHRDYSHLPKGSLASLAHLLKALSKSIFFTPPAAAIPFVILSYILFSTLGATGTIVGRTATQSSTNRCAERSEEHF